MPIATTVDPAKHTASAVVDHFTPFQFADGSSPSSAFLPSLQGWQASLSTGAASYSYPIDVPAGPGGLKPSLSLSYSSAATDGDAGKRTLQQAGWAGQGWSIDTGSSAVNKLATGGVYYTLVLNGQSYDLLCGAALVSNPGPTESYRLGLASRHRRTDQWAETSAQARPLSLPR